MADDSPGGFAARLRDVRGALDRPLAPLLADWYHVPVLGGIVALMLALRLRAYGAFIRGGDVLFSGNDAWWHLRETTYVVRHWPATAPFDPWTYFPHGTVTGDQFGSLYDRLVATAALALGGGSPGETLVAKTLLVAPAVFGALTAVPVYYVGKRLGGRPAGLFGAGLLLLLPGAILERTLVGVADHNGVEPFFQAVAVAALLVAVGVAERDKPVWELLVAREWGPLRPTVRWGVAAGVAVALYMWVWPPGVLLVAVVAVFLLLKAASDTYAGDSPEPVAVAVAVFAGVAALLMLVRVSTLSFETTSRSLLQPLFCLLVAGEAVVLAWLARQWEARAVPVGYYPWTVLGLVVAALGATAVLLPAVFATVESNFYRILAFSTSAATRTIGEAQPFLAPGVRRGRSPVEQILAEYGLTFFAAALGAIWLLARPILARGGSVRVAFVGGSLGTVGVIFAFPAVHTALAGAVGVSGQVFGLGVVAAIVAVAVHLARFDAAHLLVLVWAGFVTAAAFTQLRFNYYLALAVVALCAFLLGQVLEVLDLRIDPLRIDPRRPGDLPAARTVAVLATVALVVTPVLVVPLSVAGGQARTATAWDVAGNHGPRAITQWDGTLEWLRTETPHPGTFGDADDPMAYYGRYEPTGDFDYPDGAYGVMSWWDYGHWLTVRAERIPDANPFQNGATAAAHYLLAPTETRAERTLPAESDGAGTRYVVVDWETASPGSKFGAPVVFHENASRGDFLREVYGPQFRSRFRVRRQRYYRSQLVRLYMYHGSARDPAPVVLDWETREVRDQRTGERFAVNTVPGDGPAIRTFDSVDAAREYVAADGTAQVGGVGPYPSRRVPALEHYRLVKASTASARAGWLRDQLDLFRATGLASREPALPSSPAWVKVFERVPGATVAGRAPPGSTVTARVRLAVPSTGETFVYEQRATADADGTFGMVLPYATTGYDDYGPANGHTNVSVRATGPYTFTTAGGDRATRIPVAEASVVGDRERPVQVSLVAGDRSAEETAGGH